jgi:hypothetical protein
MKAVTPPIPGLSGAAEAPVVERPAVGGGSFDGFVVRSMKRIFELYGRSIGSTELGPEDLWVLFQFVTGPLDVKELFAGLAIAVADPVRAVDRAIAGGRIVVSDEGQAALTPHGSALFAGLVPLAQESNVRWLDELSRGSGSGATAAFLDMLKQKMPLDDGTAKTGIKNW